MGLSVDVVHVSQMRAVALVAVLSASVTNNGCFAQQPKRCFPNLAGRTSEMNNECCDEPEEDCSSGRPATCNAGCARLLLPFFSDCGSLLGAASSDYQDVVALCQIALPDWTPGQEEPTQPPPAVDCAGSWSPCTESCESAHQRRWHETAAQVGVGRGCPASTNCYPGEDRCPLPPAPPPEPAAPGTDHGEDPCQHPYITREEAWRSPSNGHTYTDCDETCCSCHGCHDCRCSPSGNPFWVEGVCQVNGGSLDGLEHDDGDKRGAGDAAMGSGRNWIRFVGEGGDALPVTPDQIHGVHRCGTDSTGWLSGCPRNAGGHLLPDGRIYRGKQDFHCNTPGHYPTVSSPCSTCHVSCAAQLSNVISPCALTCAASQPEEGVVDGVACFVDGGVGTCGHTEALKVVNCGDFLLWQLNEPRGSAWPTAYCTVDSGLFPTDGTGH